MHTSIFWVIGLAVMAFSSASVAQQTQHPLTQQLQNNAPAPVQAQSYVINPVSTAESAVVTQRSSAPTVSSAASATRSVAAQTQARTAPVTNSSTNAVVRNQSPAAQQQAVQQTSRTYAPRAQIGEVTRSLLTAQARPDRRGTEHTVLGITATRTWERYLRSFEHEIPERFEQLEAQRTSR